MYGLRTCARKRGRKKAGLGGPRDHQRHGRAFLLASTSNGLLDDRLAADNLGRVRRGRCESVGAEENEEEGFHSAERKGEGFVRRVWGSRGVKDMDDDVLGECEAEPDAGARTSDKRRLVRPERGQLSCRSWERLEPSMGTGTWTRAAENVSHARAVKLVGRN